MRIILTLVLFTSLLLAGCVTITDRGFYVTVKPVTDYRIAAPEVVEVLDDIEAETGQACIDLMLASEDELQLIVHIGPTRAAWLVEMRELVELSSVEHLRLVPGIGTVRLEQIREQNLVCDADGGD